MAGVDERGSISPDIRVSRHGARLVPFEQAKSVETRMPPIVDGAYIRRVSRLSSPGLILILATTLLVAACSTDSGSPSATEAPPVTAPVTTAPVTTPTATTAPLATVPPATEAPETTPKAAELPADAYTETIIDGGPNVIVASDDTIWVELHRASHVASIDPVSSSVRDLPGIEVHCSLAASADAVWATSPRPGMVTRVVPASGEASATVPLADACGAAVGEADVWITSPRDALLIELDPVTAEVVREIPSPGEAPFVVVSAGEFLWAAGEGKGGWLAIIDKSNGAVVEMRTLPETPFFDSIVFAYGSAWATSRLDPYLYRLDPATGETEAKIKIGGSPSAVVVTPNALWVSQLNGTLSLVDPDTEKVTASWWTRYTWLVAGTYAFDALWMASLEENAVIRVDVDKLTG
jgi:hypothetical protein